VNEENFLPIPLMDFGPADLIKLSQANFNSAISAMVGSRTLPACRRAERRQKWQLPTGSNCQQHYM